MNGKKGRAEKMAKDTRHAMLKIAAYTAGNMAIMLASASVFFIFEQRGPFINTLFFLLLFYGLIRWHIYFFRKF